MNRYLKEKANYNKCPVIETGLHNVGWKGWNAIFAKLKEHITSLQKPKLVIAVECYQGILEEEVLTACKNHFEGNNFLTADCFLPEKEIDLLVYPYITDDEVFGYVSRLIIDSYFNKERLAEVRKQIEAQEGLILVYGCGTKMLASQPDILIYADMARWEIQQRFRNNTISNIGSSNTLTKTSLQYKRAFYVDWRVCDRIKKEMLPRADFVLDTNMPFNPKMITGTALQQALAITVHQPLRLVPFFDPGPWGGQWMKEYCDLDKNAKNFAWCFDCVPEENSLLLAFGPIVFETPAINLVYFQTKKLLGEAVYGRFGDEFPIRFDFLDTMDGGNLSLQVHPTTEYAQEKFGIHYTQDESYYLLDAAADAFVYLGLKDETDANEMFAALETAQKESTSFDAEKYVEKWPVKKHDHILIPAGTIHCSGINSMVLEISATPFNFTFKLWDWGRLGLDGKPRPINIGHGKNVIDKSRTAHWVKKELINAVTTINEGVGWKEERTGLHKLEFIETRRHWFTKKVLHNTNGGVQVLNLIEGRLVIIESPTHAFSPFEIHYAETFIIPAIIGDFSIRPIGESEGKLCATLKAFIRTQP